MFNKCCVPRSNYVVTLKLSFQIYTFREFHLNTATVLMFSCYLIGELFLGPARHQEKDSDCRAEQEELGKI